MTRINVVPVEKLVNQHLMAEYRELPRVFGEVRKWQAKGKTPDTLGIPEDYVLGAGHIKFFANKTLYLVSRQKELIAELLKRGYNIQYVTTDHLLEGIDPMWQNDYVPTKQAIATNVARINERLIGMGQSDKRIQLYV